ncbi:sigma-70 family RNA polymerase sigma factor [Nocardioides ferulae]|uniref:sigma-70 family RNA polymerase sigma factor n=1 Tax=Nocardioides ferulae TaxID=2340821 RepID=UPI000EB13FFB|nr:sigma-70 family RNA polymerase sigma factor [Nocardioides ferulae]
MTSPAAAPELDAPADAELISAVRGGDLEAFGQLFARHVDAARRLARQLVPTADVDDLVSDAFGKVLGVLQRGGGPDLAFRAYLLTALRRVHVDRLRAGARLRSTDDLTPYDAGVPFRDTAVEGFESSTAARAFASLPERWRMVLWHLEVEGQKPADVAPLLGMSPNSVSALAYRAREGLRQAFVAMHAQDVADDACARVRSELGGFVRGGLSRRDRTKVEDHLQQCRPCAGVYLELSEVNADLAAVLAPLVLGTAATAYLGATGVVAAAGTTVSGALGWVAALPGRVRDLVATQAPASAAAGIAGVAGIAATVAVVGGVVVTTQDDGPPASAPAGAPSPPRAVASDSRGTRADGPAARSDAGAGRGSSVPMTDPATDPGTGQGAPPTVAASTAGTAAPPTDPPPPPQPPPPPSGPPSGPPSAGVDASVSASSRDLAGLLWGVDVTVRGLSSGTRGRLLLSTNAPAVALTLDPRCGLLQLGRATCRAPGPATYRFLVVPLPVATTTLTFRVAHDGGETDPTDDTVRVRLHR